MHVPSFPGVPVTESSFASRDIVGVETSITAFVGSTSLGPAGTPTTVRSQSEYARTFGPPSTDHALGHLVRDFFRNGGREAVVVRLVPSGSEADPLSEADYAGDEAARTGVWSLLDVDLVNLVCLAPPRLGGDVPPVAWQAASRLCVARRAFLLVDTPVAATTVHDVATFASTVLGITGTDARNAALYFPRLRESDPSQGGAIVEVPCSGAVAGVVARTDTDRGVGTSPSGTSALVTGAIGLAVPVTDADQGTLNPLGICCLRARPDGSILVWGARTLRGSDALADDYRYVPVRRLALFLEESLVRGLAWVAFEPNDEPLRAAIRRSVDTFLADLFRDRVFAGRTARDSYFVHCDATTTTQADVDAGVVHVDIGIAPLRPAEFVVLRLTLRTASG